MPPEKKVVPGPESFNIPTGSDAAAEAEATGYASGRLKEISEENEHGRRERFKDHAARGAVIILWILMVATAIAIVALAVHYLTPWTWLTARQTEAIQTYVFSGAVVAAIGGYLKRYLE